MRRVLLFFGYTAAAVLAAAAVFVAVTLPPRAQHFSPASRDPHLVWGAYHVHSTRSDGSGSVDDIAAAAARAGLQFVILTDHGDATRLEAPQYRRGVLLIDAVEISTAGGHLAALNLRAPSPYPLAGEARDVIEDIHRLGGWAVAAHPDSPRNELRWRAPGPNVDGFEWLNVDSEWRHHAPMTLLATGLRAWVRGPESLSALLTDAPQTLERWDARSSASGRISLAALDAHARIGADSAGDDGARPALRYPSYESLFLAVAQAAALEHPFTGDATADAREVLASVGAGQSFSVVRGIADTLTPVGFRVSDAAEVTAAILAAPHAELRLLRNGRRVASGTGTLRFDASGAPGRYRLQVFLPGHAFPWITMNSIDIGGEVETDPALQSSPASDPAAAGPTFALSAWVIEKDPASNATVSTSATGAVLRYELGTGKPAGQYVALAATPGPEAVERIQFVGQSSAPMRISVQMRGAGGADAPRWRRSVYLDTTPRTVVVRLADLEPVDRRSALRPVIARMQSVLIVVDTVNSLPGSAGSVTLRDVRLVRGTNGSAAPQRTP